MAHTFTFTVTATVERDQGKFASRDEIAEELMSAIESADPGYISGIGADGNTDYSVTDWTVEES